MLLKTQTSEVREEVSSSVSWIFKASGVASKAFYISGVGFFFSLVLFLFLFRRGKELISKVQRKMRGKTTPGACL